MYGRDNRFIPLHLQTMIDLDACNCNVTYPTTHMPVTQAVTQYSYHRNIPGEIMMLSTTDPAPIPDDITDNGSMSPPLRSIAK